MDQNGPHQFGPGPATGPTPFGPGPAPFGPGPFGPGPGQFGVPPTIPYRAVRRRRPVLLVTGIIALVLGAVGLAAGIVLLVQAAGDLLDDRVAEGTVPSRSASFEAVAGDYTVVVLKGGFENDDLVERQVGDTVCTAELADGRTARIDGGRQATSVSTGSGNTVGWFTAVPGPTRVSCVYERSYSDRDFAVVVGRPPNMLVGFGLLFGAIIVGLAGIFATIFGVRGKVVLLQ